MITITVMVIAAPTAAPPITQGSYSSDVKKALINSGAIVSRSQCRPVAAVATLYQSHTGVTTRPVICARRQGFIVRQNRGFTEWRQKNVKQPPGGGFTRYREDVKISVRHLF